MILSTSLKKSGYYTCFLISTGLFLFHTLLLINLKVASYNFDIINSILLVTCSGAFKFDTMGVSWLYIASTVILLCQLGIMYKSSLVNIGYNWTSSAGNISYGWWVIYLSVIHISLTALFLTDNVLIFYIAFETTLLPFFLWIGEAALRSRRWHAAFFLVFFTLVGSIGMLWAIGILYKINYSFVISDYELSFCRVTGFSHRSDVNEFFYLINSFDVTAIQFKGFFSNLQSLWFAFILFTFSFLIKFPVFPVASWLPEAHVEASTEASVLLAAVLLKVAPFGFYKIIIPSFSIWYLEYRSVLWIVGLFSALLYASSLLSQTDLKRSIAYTSIIHMSVMLCLLGGISKTSLDSAFLMGALHSYCSAGLFFCIGFLYDKDKSKNIHYISGLSYLRPAFSTFFVLFNLVNVGYPLIGSYISEALLFVASVSSSNYIYITILILVLYVLTASVFFMISKVLYRSWETSNIRKVLDVSSTEKVLLLLLFLACLMLGIVPSVYLNYVEDSIFRISETLNYDEKCNVL